ncbi:conserved hypothetical protein [Agrobacterium sp. NCPPB 925]|nr:conserved hypothetical protein [Agrobacterium sp. NCPPB 925]
MLLPGEPALHGQRAFFHLLCQGDDPMALLGKHETVRGPLEERVADGILKGTQPSADGRMACMKSTRSTAERAGSRNRKEDFYVAPLHGRALTKVNGENTKLSLQVQI